jgi:hypothetical protein
MERVSLAAIPTEPISLGEARIDADFLGTSRPAPASPAIVAVLTEASAGSSAREVVVSVGDASFRFPGGDPYAAGPSLDLANVRWGEVAAALGRAKTSGAGGAALRISEDAPWAHVVQVLALLLQAGLADVAIDGGSRLALSTPSERAGMTLGSGGGDWPIGVPIGIGVGIAVAVFALGALTGPRPRTTRAKDLPSGHP